jgi:UDP-N-acetylglucosamine transferase subunit ALG13
VDDLALIMNEASLVITHCGAGSTFEALSKGIPVLAVPNPMLMDNHQQELANTLSRGGYLVRMQSPARCSSHFDFSAKSCALCSESLLGFVCALDLPLC